MAGRVLGDALVVINPDASGFRQLADVQLRKQLAGFRPNVVLGLDTKEANLALTGLQARIKAMSGRLTELRLNADSKPAEAGITRIQARLAVLARQMTSLTMGTDTKKIDAAIAAEKAKIAGLRQQMGNLQLDADAAKAASKIADLEKQAAHLEESLDTLEADVDIRAATAKIVSIEAELKVLRSNAKAVQIAADNKAFLAQIAASEAVVKRLKQEASDIRLGANIDMGKLLAAEAALLGIEHTVGELGKKEAPVAETAMNAFFASTGRGATAAAAGWRLLTGHITLFGGALNRVLPRMFTSVAVWHLLADAVIETVAVWAPAIIAVTAFGVAGADAAREVYNRMLNVHTVMDATGRAVPPLSRNFERLAAAVRPEVYQLFGDALVVMNKRGGAFNTVATQTGKVLDQLAARFVVAVTTGSGVNKFMENAVNDVRLLGDSIGNFGGIFGAVFRAVPGYAEILLKVGDWMTRVLEAFTQAAEPVIAFGLALHGFFIYGGTAVTLFLAMVGGLVKLTGAFFNFNKAVTLVGLTSLKTFATAIAGGIANLITYSGVMIGVATSEGIAAAATGVLSDAMLVLSRVPIMVWITLAAAAVAGLIFAFRGAHSAAQDFVNGVQKTIQNAQLPALLGAIGTAQTQVTGKLAEAQAKLARTQEYTNGVNFKTGETTRQVTDAYRQQEGVVSTLQAAHSQLGQQFQLVSTRVGRLAKEYGGTTQALGLLNLAGVTTAQILDKSKSAWDIIKVQVEATTAAYKAMGVQAGQLGNDLDVLGRTETDQYTATQKLNQAWTSFISDVTSTQGSFDTVAQGYQTLNDHAGKLTISLGKLKAKYDDQKAAIDSLTPQGIALNQAFTDQVRNVDALFASWRTAGLANNLFTSGVKDAIAPLVKYAAGSKEATAQLIALAQEAGYQGPISLAALTKWLGNTHGATQKLKDITNQATAQEALLTGAMQAQGSYIANTLLRDIDNAILKYNGVEKAAAAYGNAVARSGQQSDAAHQARATLITDLIKSGTAAHDSTGQIAAMITKVLGIPPKEALQIVMRGTGSYTINGALISSTGQSLPQPGLHPHAATGGYLNMAGRLMRAAGGYIDLGSGPTADDVPVMASRGEYVVKASSVAKYGKGTMDAINAGAFADGGLVGRYATGGLVRTGNPDVLSGQYAVTMATDFQNRMIKSQAAAMQAAIKKGEQQAQGLSTPVGNIGSGVARWAPLVRQVLAMEGLSPSLILQVLYQIQTESGGNPNAINLTDINAQRGDPSRGLLQTIMSTFLAYHWPGTSYNIYDPEANIAAAINYARHTYGPTLMSGRNGLGSGHGYAAGGLIGFAGGGQIPLGKYLPQLRTAQGNEYHDYLGLRKAYLADLAHAKKGSWTSGHKAGIRSELGTLAKVQSAEEAAYDNILHHGTAKANLTKFASRIKAVTRTSRDKDLAHSHPAFTHGLQYWLGVLTHLSQADVAPVYGGSQAKLLFPAWLGKAKAAQSHEVFDYRGLESAFKTGLAHARKGTWLYSNRKALASRLSIVTARQNAEAAAYADLIRHSSGSVSDLAGLAGRIGKLGSQAGAEAGSLQPSLLGHLPGGHPGWLKALQAQLKILTSLSASPPFNPPWAPGNLGPSHTVAGGVLTFDRGGLLPPGLHMTWNGTGRAEKITPDQAGPSEIHLHVHNNGVIASQQQADAWLQTSLNRLARTGYLTQAANQATGR